MDPLLKNDCSISTFSDVRGDQLNFISLGQKLHHKC